MGDELLSVAAPIGGWLVTYLIHSALLVGLAYLIVRRLESRRPQLGDVAWKIALVGALVTSSVQMKTGLSPFGGALAPATAEVEETTTGPVLDADWAVMARVMSEPASVEPEPTTAAVDRHRERDRAVAGATEDEPPRVVGANLAPVRTEIVAVERAPLWLAVVVAAWLAGALLFGGALFWGWARLRWLLRRRQPIKGRPAELLDRVAWRAGLRQPIRLSVVEGLDVPIAFGVFEPEIALPARAEQLDEDRLETLLAHECAHLVRRDPGWRLLGSAIRSVFWIQPLNRLVCRRLESCSELCADDWAVAHTDRPLELARCLTEVAGWLSPRGIGASVPAMARPGSVLGTRVRRLVSESDREHGGSRWFGVAALAVVVGIAFAAPGASNAAAPVSQVLPTAADAADSDVRDEVAAEVSPADAERAARALRQLVDNTASKVPVDQLIARLQSGELDADAVDAILDGAVAQWLEGPGLDIDFDVDFEVFVDEDDDEGDDDDDDGTDEPEILDPRDFIDGFNKRSALEPGDIDIEIDPSEIEREVSETLRDQLGRARQAKESCDDDARDWQRFRRRHAERARRHAERARERAQRIRVRLHERAARVRARAEHRRRVFEKAIEAQRRALEKAMKARGEALESAAEAREQVERAMREAERALRQAEEIRRRLRRHHDHGDDGGDDDDE